VKRTNGNQDKIGGKTLSRQDKKQNSMPNKKTAEALLEYIAMEECKTKKIIETLCSSEIEKCFKWLDSYCEETACTQEQVLNQIIEGEI
jgi:hypothetical protein